MSSGNTRPSEDSRAAMKRFLVDALGGALDLGFAVPDDVLKHITPDVLAEHLPRPLWAKLITACLDAPRVDARLLVDTIGVRDLCEHMPSTLIWQVVTDVAVRALGKGLLAAPPPAEKSEKAEKSGHLAAPAAAPVPVAVTSSGPVPVATPVAASGPSKAPILTRPATSPGVVSVPPKQTPPVGVPETAAPSPSGRATTVTSTQTTTPPVAAAVDIIFDDDEDDEPAPLEAPPVSPHRAQTVGGPSGRASSTGNGNTRPPIGAGASTRRPQASAVGTGVGARTKPRTMPPSSRRAVVSSDFDLDTDVGTHEKQPDAVPVDDEQLVDWSASEETVTSDHGHDRKR